MSHSIRAGFDFPPLPQVRFFRSSSVTTPASLSATICRKLCVPPHSGAPVVGRGHDKDSLSLVQSADIPSRRTVSPCFVADALQFGKDSRKRNSNKSRNVLTDNAARAQLSDNPEHLRPEVTIVLFSFLLSSHGEGLAWESAGNNVNCS